jgi:cytochrome c oxidase subunit 2
MDEASNWLDKLPPAEAGQKLYTSLGCAACHSTDGTARVGPTFQTLYGHEVPLKGGGKVTADENYIRESILQPAAQVVAGFEPVMPTYQGRIRDKEITVIIEYLKSLK